MKMSAQCYAFLVASASLDDGFTLKSLKSVFTNSENELLNVAKYLSEEGFIAFHTVQGQWVAEECMSFTTKGRDFIYNIHQELNQQPW